MFSIVDHEPTNYEETRNIKDHKGTDLVSTRRVETVLILKAPSPALNLKYIAPEDLINIVANQGKDRVTLIRRLYYDRDLDPKKGVLKAGEPMKVKLSDLVIAAEEFDRFDEFEVEKIRKVLPLPSPEKVSIQWLLKNLPVHLWFAGASVITAAFLLGVAASESGFWSTVTSPKTSSSQEKK